MLESNPNPIDIYVGARVRALRKMSRLSQQDLALGLGLTFQQVQKYERGTNRISASKLFDIAKTLNVRVSYFFEGYEPNLATTSLYEITTEQAVNCFLASSEGVELAEAFPRVKTRDVRRKILDLVRALSKDDEA